MAQIDIGKLTFTHKGDYAGGTAYVANDVVYYNGSAYIAKTSTTGNLPTSTAHWNTFASGSGGIWNAGLSLGTAGQVVKVNSAANALEFGSDIGGKLLQVIQVVKTSEGSTTSTSFVSTGLELQITPSATSSKILVMANNPSYLNSGNEWYYNTLYRGSTNLSNNDTFAGSRNNGNTIGCSLVCNFLDSPNSTSQQTYKLMHRVSNSGATGYVYSASEDQTQLILYQVNGEFQKLEEILVNGQQINRTISDLDDYGIQDVRQLVAAGGVAFTADTKLTNKIKFAEPGSEYTVSGESAGVSTIT